MSHYPKLNLPPIKLRARKREDNEVDVWDSLRGAFLRLTPEEWVRQHILGMLITHMGYEPMQIRCEHLVDINGQSQRADVVVFTNEGKPFILVECKAPGVAIKGDTFTQAARYNMVLGARYILLTNGMTHETYEACDSGYRTIATIPHNK